jgi:hypothetical protein
VRADIASFAICHADSADVSVSKRPAGALFGDKPIVSRLDVERDDAHEAQIGQCGRWLPTGHDTSSDSAVFLQAHSQ